MKLKLHITKTDGTVEVIKAPKWLIRRMEELKRMPPPSLDDVEKSFRAAKDYRARHQGTAD